MSTPPTLQALVIAALVFLPGILAARTYRNMAGLRPGTSREDRFGNTVIWSAINGTLLLLFWGWVGPTLERVMVDGATLRDRGWLAFLTTLLPFALAIAAGLVSRFTRVRDWMQRSGFMHSESSPPWDRLTSPRGDQSPGFWIYFDHNGESYCCESARTSSSQIYGQRVHLMDATGTYLPMEGVTGVLLIEFGERVLFLGEDEPL